MGGARASIGTAILAAAVWCAGCASTGLANHLPQGLPDVSGWEHSSGRVEFDNPRRTLEYELIVNPERPGVYSIARYRIRLLQREAAASTLADAEKLQWDRDGVDVRRYVCEPNRTAWGCHWRELARHGREYDLEMPTLLSLYALHARLLNERDAGRLH